VEWVVREWVGQGGEITQALYAHMNNKRKKNNVREIANRILCIVLCSLHLHSFAIK
jgi:hypothetical protein